MLSAGLGMAWNRYGLSCNSQEPEPEPLEKKTRSRSRLGKKIRSRSRLKKKSGAGAEKKFAGSPALAKIEENLVSRPNVELLGDGRTRDICVIS